MLWKMWVHLCLCPRASKMWSGNHICGKGRPAGIALGWFLDISFPIVGFCPFIPTSSKWGRTTTTATIRCDILMSTSSLESRSFVELFAFNIGFLTSSDDQHATCPSLFLTVIWVRYLCYHWAAVILLIYRCKFDCIVI